MNKEKTNKVLDYFEELFPDAHCELNHQNVFELLVAVMLSAQTTDKKVNQVTASLFKKYPTVESFALASLEDLQNDIKIIGLYRNKAKNLKKMAQVLLEEYNGGLPEIEECSCNYSPKNTSDMTDEQLQCVDVWDDGVTWAEGHLRRPELKHIIVCHAIHDICTHKPYSIPDLLRLNDFWVEAHLVCQHIIDQNGKRYNSD